MVLAGEDDDHHLSRPTKNKPNLEGVIQVRRLVSNAALAVTNRISMKETKKKNIEGVGGNAPEI